MSFCWLPNGDYVTFDPKQNRIGEVIERRRKFLPYQRDYSTLSHTQLLELIQEAKNNNWEALDLSCCELNELPDELWELTDLRILYIGNGENPEVEHKNNIKKIPQDIEKLKNLQVLSISGLTCNIDKKSPLDLPNLLYLDMYNCPNYAQIPDALLIPSIEALGFCCLEDNLSSDFLTLTNLKEAFLTRSKIQYLPDDIDRLQNLIGLYLWDSNIATLPSSMLKMEGLTKLIINNTPLAQIVPPEILHQSAQDIIRYIINQQSGAPKEYFFESKMIIVGQGSVGKTSLLKRLVDNTYSEKKSTEGINISPWYYHYYKNEIRLNIWDFGGQEIYHATHQFFLTKRSLYLFVWDALAEKEYGRIDYWLKTIQSLANDSPIIIVVNKCDKNIGRIDRLDVKEYKTKYPQIQDILYVSCKDDINIEKLRKLIKRTAAKLPLMRMKWLKTWMDVRRKIEQEAIKNDYISYTKYIEICLENGITDDEEALSLVKYLHDLGIVLHYHDDPLLKDLVILSSTWGTNAVYKILDEQERRLKGRNGILFRSDLSVIWKKKYPEKYYPHLLNLMENFQLAFKLNPKTYLIAELLSNDSIDREWNYNKTDTLSFRYKYDFLPAGVMTRLIVSMHQYLITEGDRKQCWRKGAYLSYKDAQALVRLVDDISNHYVQIDVIGEDRDRKELLQKIRDKLDEINSRYTKIRITQQIPCCCSEECELLFDYDSLLSAEKRGIATIQCHSSWRHVQLSRLLDGVINKQMTENSVVNNYNTHMSDAHLFDEAEVYECKGINKQLYEWALSSPLYQKAVNTIDEISLAKALGPNETERYQESFSIIKTIWEHHPELGLMPDYVLLSKREHEGAYYPGYRDHLTHMFKVYLLGMYFYEKDKKLGKKIDEKEFFLAWTLSALWHDIGYLIETEDGKRNSVSAQEVFKGLSAILSVPLTTLFSDKNFEAEELKLQHKNRVQTFPAHNLSDCTEKLDILKSVGKNVGLTHVSTPNPIVSYYEFMPMPQTGRSYYDHGIVSASFLLYMCDELCLYMEGSNVFALDDEMKKRRDEFVNNMEEFKSIVTKAATAIALHNIIIPKDKEIQVELCGKGVNIAKFKINFKTEPLSWLLRVCDEIQCWDRQRFDNPLENDKPTVNSTALHFDEKNGKLLFKNMDDKQKILNVLQSIITPLPSFLD